MVLDEYSHASAEAGGVFRGYFHLAVIGVHRELAAHAARLAQYRAGAGADEPDVASRRTLSWSVKMPGPISTVPPP